MGNPVRIQITSGNVGADGKVTNDTQVPGTVQASGSSSVMKAIGATQLIGTGLQCAKRVGSYAISQYGNYTGDYLAQQNIDNALSNISVGVSLLSTVASGAMVGGGIGAVVAAAGWAGTQVITGALAMNTERLNTRRNNQSIAFSSQLIGDILKDGNR